MPEPNEKDEGSQKDPLEAVKAVAESIREAVTAQAQRPITVQVAAPQPATSKPDPREAQLAGARKLDEALDKYDELSKAGDYRGAVAHLIQTQVELSQTSQVDVSEQPAYKALVKQAERAAKSENKPLFDKYQDEIKAEIDSMPATDRINPDMWDEAIRRVKARHFDELVKEAVDERVKATQTASAPRTPQNRGTQGTATDETVELDEDAIAIGAMMGYSPEKYAELTAENEKHRIRRGLSRGMVKLVSDDRPRPGAF